MSSATMFFSFSLMFLLIVLDGINAQAPKRRFEYKLSFKGPHLVQRDNSVPFWEYFGGKNYNDICEAFNLGLFCTRVINFKQLEEEILR